MKILIDALGAPEGSGGMQLYATELVSALALTHPDDSLVVLTGSWAADAFSSLPNVMVVPAANASAVKRAWGQYVGAAHAFFKYQADILLSVSPIVSPFVKRGRTICVVHDWRHVHSPEQFSRAQRAYRRLWARSASRAAAAVMISDKTSRETAQIAPSANRVTVENGRDHIARHIDSGASRSDAPMLVTFGHHNNKRPELMIDAIAEIVAGGEHAPVLVVLGAQGVYAAELRARAQSAGVADLIRFPGFVSDSEYASLLRQAHAVALVSSDEGFGLPVAEAQFLDIPAIVTTDSGLSEIFPVGPLVSEPTPFGLARAIRSALQPGASRWADVPLQKWETTARGIRGIAAALVDRT